MSRAKRGSRGSACVSFQFVPDNISTHRSFCVLVRSSDVLYSQGCFHSPVNLSTPEEGVQIFCISFGSLAFLFSADLL